MEILGYLGAILIGVSLGVIGGGGSILTVPLLVYIFDIDPVLATAYSLFIVGATSLLGGIPKYTQGLVNMRTVINFGIPSIIAVLFTRAVVVPAIPDNILRFGNFHVAKPQFFMVMFGILMTAAAWSMVKDHQLKQSPRRDNASYRTLFVTIEGLVVGSLTGLVGAGGGFLIIPTLVMFSKLPMKIAVGTSLIIIAAKSLIGFLGDVANHKGNMDWMFLSKITILAAIGIFVGHRISKKWDGEKLKKNFGRIILVLGIGILIAETVKMIKL